MTDESGEAHPPTVRLDRVRADDVESTTGLLERAHLGDREAVEALFRRYVPRLRRWAAGRLPNYARDLADTHDLVQDTLLQTFKQVDRFEPRFELAFQVYVRNALLNRIRQELRRFKRQPERQALDDQSPDHDGPSPFESAIGTEAAERYERALEQLRPEERELIVARVEMACSFEEIARATGKPTAEAARKACQRALVRLAQEMGLRR